MYYFGWNKTPKDKKKAFEIFHNCYQEDQQITSRQTVQVLFLLGRMYHHGQGIEKNIEKAIEFYEKSNFHGNCVAINNLALIYHKGEQVEKNVPKAVELYEKAVGLGNSVSMYNLALIYRNGAEGVEKDSQKCVELLEQASQKGHQKAIALLTKLKRFY